MTTPTITPPQVEVGDFFVSSWGYDQTNVDFYKVLSVSASGKTIQVQMWGARSDISGQVVPSDQPANYPKWIDGQMVGTVDARIQTRRVRSWSDRPSFTVNSYSAAYLWDGRAAYQTPAGAGH